jgi:hypothetical protein
MLPPTQAFRVKYLAIFLLPIVTRSAAAEPTKDEIIRGIVANYEAFKKLPAFSITYTIDYKHVNGIQRFAFDHLDVANSQVGPKMRSEIKARGFRGDKNAELQRLVTWNGRTGMAWRENNQVDVNSHAETLLYYYRYYFDYLHMPDGSGIVKLKFPIPEEIRKIDDYWLPETLQKAANEYILQPKTEKVTGKDCYVLERPGRDKLWVDVDNGFLLRRRDLFWEDKVNLRHRTNTDKPRNSQGFVHPASITREVFGDPKVAGDPPNKVCERFVLEVNGANTAISADSEFTITIPDGVRVVDSVNKKQYTKGGDPASKKAPLASAPAVKSNNTETGLGWSAILIAVIAVFGLAGTWSYRHLRRQ